MKASFCIIMYLVIEAEWQKPHLLQNQSRSWEHSLTLGSPTGNSYREELHARHGTIDYFDIIRLLMEQPPQNATEVQAPVLSSGIAT